MIRSLVRLSFIILWNELGCVVISADAAVDVEVEGNEESIGGVIEENFHPQGIVLMVEEGYDFTDKTSGCFKKTAV